MPAAHGRAPSLEVVRSVSRIEFGNEPVAFRRMRSRVEAEEDFLDLCRGGVNICPVGVICAIDVLHDLILERIAHDLADLAEMPAVTGCWNCDPCVPHLIKWTWPRHQEYPVVGQCRPIVPQDVDEERHPVVSGIRYLVMRLRGSHGVKTPKWVLNRVPWGPPGRMPSLMMP